MSYSRTLVLHTTNFILVRGDAGEELSTAIEDGAGHRAGYAKIRLLRTVYD